MAQHTHDAARRYAPNVLVPGFGEAGQARLAAARVLIVGLGGLGSPAAYYLAAAGVGTLGLMDPDRVEVSNLQRQIVYATADVGRGKTAAAAETLAALNPEVVTERIDERLTPANARDMLVRFDVVVDASDNFETKFLVNDVCLELGKPFATAGILAVSGQALFVAPGRTACLRCALPAVPQDAPTTAQFGVLGPVPGVLGSLEALEVIRWIAGLWREPADGAVRLHALDGETMQLRTVRVPPRSDCRCARLWNKI